MTRLLLIISLFLLPFTASASDKPNILLVFLDNFGWGEPGFNGGGIIRGAATPRMDQVAAEGQAAGVRAGPGHGEGDHGRSNSARNDLVFARSIRHNFGLFPRALAILAAIQ